MENESAQEITRIILGLRSAKWNDEEINDFLLWVGADDERYRPEMR